MTLTNTKTILRQIGARGMAAGYISHDPIDRPRGYSQSFSSERKRKSIGFYVGSIRKIGGVATIVQISEATGRTASTVASFLRRNSEHFEKTEVMVNGTVNYLIKVRNK